VRETEFTPNFKGILGSNRWSNAYSGFNPLEALRLLFADIEHSFACSHCICKKIWHLAQAGSSLILVEHWH
ncbi:MAG: hypothetical protein L6Q78_11515, partial [Bacteroidia bacterium]|nr:hypothetical protein [Bacteroidia bacterium]